ncbi:PIN/TRAM domain-containing protein [Melissococcus plutonius]|uniref:PIN/TRAM domain-containing protein n=1 Tax=Melissococcus plutonius TaxID=33970 RepID=UPI003C2C6AF9
MKKRIITLLMILIGISLGIAFLPPIWQAVNLGNNHWLNTFTNGLFGAFIFFILSLLVEKYIIMCIKKLEAYLNKISLTYLLFGSLGAIIGLTFGLIISIPLYNLNIMILDSLVPILLMILLGYLGFHVGAERHEDWRKIFVSKQKRNTNEMEKSQNNTTTNLFHKYKILDTSVIIDGRIYDIARTGFLEGILLIPNFVLYELQYIADSGDNLKRVRGRRGLDILNALQKESDISVEMYDGDFEEITEVDSKLIKLAKLLDGIVVTNDYNLNKVSEFQNIPVLNINALANAVKPVVIPGETMEVMVVKAGTERQQGVAYLDDGTMIVVEDGQNHMNEQLQVTVTSALQTAAGRMIFAKPTNSNQDTHSELKENDQNSEES